MVWGEANTKFRFLPFSYMNSIINKTNSIKQIYNAPLCEIQHNYKILHCAKLMLLKIYVAISLDNYKERQLVMNSFNSEFKSQD